MQSTTGCKINVAPASGHDIEREIGLVGTRSAIDQAKRAIRDKVHAVVSLAANMIRNILTLQRRRRIAEEVDRVVMSSSTISTHIRSSLMANRIKIKIKIKIKTSSSHKVKLKVEVTWILMQPTVATKTTLRYGIQA